MPALTPTDHYGEVTYIGRVASREASLRSVPISRTTVGFSGIEGEDHGGLTRPSCVRFSEQHPKGTEIRNFRQLSIVSVEEMAQIADAMGLDRLDPEWLGASLVLRGIADLSHLPPGSRLQSEAGTTLYVDLENGPCVFVGREIEQDRKGFGAAFKPAAKGLRGVTACVEREGPLAVGDRLRLHVPTQRAWQPETRLAR